MDAAIDTDAYKNAVRSYATRALKAAMKNDTPDEPMRVIRELADEWGSSAPVHACLAWADTFLEHVGIPPEIKCADVAFVDETGRIDLAAEAPAAARWAVRWLLARRDMDEAASVALVRELPSEREWGQAILALLDIVALGLREGTPGPTLGDVLLRAAMQGSERGEP